MKTKILLTAACLAAAGNLHAFELESTELTLGTGKLQEVDGFGISTRNESIAGAVNLNLTENLDLRFGITHADQGDFFPTLDMTVFSLTAMQHLTEGLAVGAFWDRTKFSDSFGNSTIDHYGIEASYTYKNLTLTGFVGQGDYKMISEKSDVAGLSAGYAFANGLDVGAFYLQENSDFIGDQEAYGITVGVELTGPAQTPVYLNASLGRTDGFLGVADLARVTLTVPFGGKARNGRKPVHGHSVEMDSFSYFNHVSNPTGF
ncbi:hypothetical protein Q4544_09515 [Cognatishimia sp. 1_MG-2023]|uniref:porin n=1 Tax=Cognatishimia sp. 1_MG-2023 TaxID=3062642 RepID=UPI0026E1704F|nr:porin [Cognatishimia sp. 1_MG-2023]MDO6727171.1 hypothetical protein [Cognatishimia sp. 1_MG-2023]